MKYYVKEVAYLLAFMWNASVNIEEVLKELLFCEGLAIA